MKKYKWENWKEKSAGLASTIEEFESIVGKPLEEWCAKEKEIVDRNLCVLEKHRKKNVLQELVEAGLRRPTLEAYF